MTRHSWLASLWLLLSAALFTTAYLLINTTFMFYDDEGYLLLTYKNFLAGGRLYDDVFSQYGPWPYVYHQLVTTILHQPLTHMLGRNLTAIHWTLCALLCGLTVGRITKRTVTAVSATLITFGLLWQMDQEPSHPGSLIAAMLAAATIAIVSLHSSGRWNWLGATAGVTGALLILTKINVGLLFITGVGVGALRLTAWSERWRRPGAMLATVGLLVVPWCLMAKKLGEPWVLNFAIQFTAAAAGLLWVTPPSTFARLIPPRTWAVTIWTFLLTLVIVTATVCGQGTSLPALLQTVLINPLRQPGSFMFGFTWLPEVWPVAIVCWLTTMWAGWELRQRETVSRATRFIVIALRLIALLFFMFNAWTWLTINGVTGFMVFCLPLLPIFLVPLEVNSSNRNYAGILLATGIALPQVLHAFPVAGSQLGWGTFLFVPVMIIGLNEAWIVLGREAPRTGCWLPRVGGIALLLVGGWQFELLATNGWQRYSTSKPLNLPGAEDIRLDGQSRSTLQVITTNAAVHADVLFSRPGMFSYNQWSGVPTPTSHNATHWFWLLDKPAQRSIEEKLRSTRRTAIITNQKLDEFLKQAKVPTDGSLATYIEKNYRSIFDENRKTFHSFDFLVPLDSRAVPFGLVDVRGQKSPATDERYPYLIRSNIILNGLPAIIQIENTFAPWRATIIFSGPGAQTYLVPITPNGDATGPRIACPTNQPLRGLYQLLIFLTELPPSGLHQNSVLTVLDSKGTVLSESAF